MSDKRGKDAFFQYFRCFMQKTLYAPNPTLKCEHKLCKSKHNIPYVDNLESELKRYEPVVYRSKM